MTATKDTIEQPQFTDCQPKPVRALNISGKTLAVEESHISLIREITPQKRSQYLKDSYVPLKDFGKFMQSLSTEFSGKLSEIKDSKLRKLILPVMVPVGMALSTIPDEHCSAVVIISNGQWHGALCCSTVADKPLNMIKFKKAKNGDIAGIGYLKSGEEVPLLNAVSLLAREGFLAMT